MSDCQAGYRSGRGTIDMLFILQILIEKIKSINGEAYITFIDYSKAFDSVNHDHLFDTDKNGISETPVQTYPKLIHRSKSNCKVEWRKL